MGKSGAGMVTTQLRTSVAKQPCAFRFVLFWWCALERVVTLENNFPTTGPVGAAPLVGKLNQQGGRRPLVVRSRAKRYFNWTAIGPPAATGRWWSVLV